MNMKNLFVTAAALAAAVLSQAAPGQEVMIRGAKVYTQTSQGALDNADVLIRAGKIAAVGRGLTAPANATVIEARGRPLTPGLFGGLSQIGLTEVGAESSTVDAGVSGAPAFKDRWRPELDLLTAFNPRSTLLAVARVEGLTWSMIAPQADSLIAGQGAAVTLDGAYEPEIAGSRSLFMNWSSSGKGIAGGTRAGEYMLLDQVVREVKSPAPNEDLALLYPAGREVVARYLAGGRVIFTADRAVDIRRTVAYARKLGVKPVIWGGAEAWVVAEELARAGVPVILHALENLPGSFDQIGARLDNAALLHKAGVKVMFSDGDSHNLRKNRQHAGNAVAHGLPWDAALAAITSVPAEVFGIGATHGHLAAGQSADVVLWSADPLEITSLPDTVWIGGRQMPLRSRQTELRDRYMERLKRGEAR
jgi:hypothetical protein